MRHPASFRDPSGFVFLHKGEVHRHISPSYQKSYDAFVRSGLYERLVSSGLLLPHEEVRISADHLPEAYRILRPEQLAFVSHPHEWCFGQVKAAALTTLAVQREAMDVGLTLKDANAYNIQFRGSQPLFIDSLSFEEYEDGAPWVAYGQFCRHFLTTLLLMSGVDVRLNSLLLASQDGIPLDLASRLLPKRSWLRPGVMVHLHLHARSVQAYEGRRVPEVALRRGLSKKALLNLLSSLDDLIQGLTWNPSGTQWERYEEQHNYSSADSLAKERFVSDVVATIRPQMVWDFGSNIGRFSSIASTTGAYVVSMDIDYGATERHFRRLRSADHSRILPLRLDLSQPSPGLGWSNRERSSLKERGPADLGLALALVHHLRISGGIPFRMIAEGLAELVSHLVIEWVPKDDPQVRKLLVSRPDTFLDYSKPAFLKALERYFERKDSLTLADSGRELIFLTVRSSKHLPTT